MTCSPPTLRRPTTQVLAASIAVNPHQARHAPHLASHWQVLAQNHALLDIHFTVYETYQALIRTPHCFPFVLDFPPSRLHLPLLLKHLFPLSSSPRDHTHTHTPLSIHLVCSIVVYNSPRLAS